MSLLDRFAPLLAEIAEGAVARERDRELPHQAVRALREAGFGALRLPVEAGGGGAGFAELVELLVELGRADSNLPQLWRGHIAFVEHVLALPAGERKERWLARLAAGEIVGNAQSEPGGAAFWKPLTRIADGVVEGRKYYSTGSIFADWIYTSGADDGGHVTALVRADGPGVERLDDWDGFGQRLTGSGTTIFTAAPAEDVTVLELDAHGAASPEDVARGDLAVFTAQGVVVDLVLRATTDVFRVGGASATAEHRALDRHWRNARTVSSHNPEIFRAATVGRALLDGTAPHDQLAAAIAAQTSQITQGVPA